MRFRPPRISLLTAAAVLSVGGVAAADPTPEAVEARLARGEAAYEAQRYDEALRVYRDLYRESRDLRALARQAQTEQAMGLWLDAWEDYEAVLRAQEDAWVTARRERITTQQREVDTHLGRVMVESNVADSWVRRDDMSRGQAPRTVRLEPGVHTISVRAHGYVWQSRRVEIAAGETLTLAFALQRPQGAAETSPGPGMRWGPAHESPHYHGLLWPAGFLALGVTMFASGVVAWSLTVPTVTAFNGDPRCGANGGHIQGGAGCQANEERATSLAMMGNLLVPFGLLFAQIGAMWLGLALDSNAGGAFRSDSPIRLSSGPGLVGAGMTYTF